MGERRRKERCRGWVSTRRDQLFAFFVDDVGDDIGLVLFSFLGMKYVLVKYSQLPQLSTVYAQLYLQVCTLPGHPIRRLSFSGLRQLLDSRLFLFPHSLPASSWADLPSSTRDSKRGQRRPPAQVFFGAATGESSASNSGTVGGTSLRTVLASFVLSAYLWSCLNREAMRRGNDTVVERGNQVVEALCQLIPHATDGQAHDRDIEPPTKRGKFEGHAVGAPSTSLAAAAAASGRWADPANSALQATAAITAVAQWLNANPNSLTVCDSRWNV